LNETVKITNTITYFSPEFCAGINPRNPEFRTFYSLYIKTGCNSEDARGGTVDVQHGLNLVM